jgi:hypothetical protein
MNPPPNLPNGFVYDTGFIDPARISTANLAENALVFMQIGKFPPPRRAANPFGLPRHRLNRRSATATQIE